MITTALFILSGLPLIFYPAVLMASVMSLAGNVAGDEPLMLMVVVYSFLILSLLYPLAYIGSLLGFFLSKDTGRKTLFIRIPYAHLGLCILLLVLWVLMG